VDKSISFIRGAWNVLISQTGLTFMVFIRGVWNVLINQTGLTFRVFTEKYDLAVNLYTVPRNTVYWCTVLYILTFKNRASYI
jgi:hypothetical protein